MSTYEKVATAVAVLYTIFFALQAIALITKPPNVVNPRFKTSSDTVIVELDLKPSQIFNETIKTEIEGHLSAFCHADDYLTYHHGGDTEMVRFAQWEHGIWPNISMDCYIRVDKTK